MVRQSEVCGVRRIVIALCIACMPVAQSEEWPQSVEHLAAFTQDESRFVDELRAYDKALLQKIDVARREASRLREQGKAEEASALMIETKGLAADLRKAYEMALERYSSNARLHNYYGELLYDGYKEVSAALREWNLALSYDGKLSAVYNNLALYEIHMGAYEQGLRNLDQALALEKDNPDYNYNMVQTYLVYWPEVKKIRKWEDKKVYREAMRLSKRAAKATPEDFDLQKDYAFNFFLAENFGVAAKWKTAAVAWQRSRELTEKKEELVYAWVSEGRVCINAGLFDNAVACLNEALRLSPDSTRAQGLLEEVERKRISSQ